MITVTVHKQSNFPVKTKVVRDVVIKTLTENGIVSNSEASVAIVNKNKMLELASQYLKETKKEAMDHPVLSFPTNEIEGRFIFPPEDVIHLGEIVISFPKALEEAKAKNRLIDNIISDLAAHGALHLIGIHHD